MTQTSIERRVLARGAAVKAPLRSDGNTFWSYYARPGFRAIGLGEAALIESRGATRFADATEQAARFSVHGAAAKDPLWFGGFAFDGAALEGPWKDWPELRFIAPRLLWIFDDRGPRLIANWVVGDEAATRELLREIGNETIQPPPASTSPAASSTATEAAEGWMKRVTRSREAIRDGKLDKVVLARMKRLNLDGEVSPAKLVERLSARPGAATTFAVGDDQRRTFLGSSPESLVRLSKGQISADALAGSSARGATPAEDRERARALLASSKDLHEHKLVVDAVRRTLGNAGASLRPSCAPRIATFPEALHLHTPIRATSEAATHLLDVAAAVHPSPAVCGTPTRPAREQLLREEPWRGWYAGGVGWMNASGDGELVVALRAALIEPKAAWCFAGAGIVDDSDPRAELAETEFKFSVMETLLSDQRRAHAA